MMEDILVLEKSEITVSERRMTDQSVIRHSSRRTITDFDSHNLVTEEGESFINYISRIDPEVDASVLVLSSKHHYYYDMDELKGVSTLINMKRLNFMNHLESFLHVIGDFLSPNARFIGCFADQKNQRRSGMPSRIYKRLITFLDGRINIEIDKKYLLRLLESCGFRIIDMTEINGLTYFTTSKGEYSYSNHVLRSEFS